MIAVTASRPPTGRRIVRDLPYFVVASTSQKSSEEDDATMPEYDMPIEEQVKLLVKKLDGFEKRLDEKFVKIDEKLVKIDERFDLVDKKFDKVDERFDLVDKKLDKVDERFDLVDKKFDKVGERFDLVDKKFDKVDEKFDLVDEKFDKVDGSLDEVKESLGEVEKTLGQIRVRLDDTNGVAKLGLEGLQGLRESMEAQFAAAAKTNADQTGLLKAVLVHVRNRVEVIERPKPRRR